MSLSFYDQCQIRTLAVESVWNSIAASRQGQRPPANYYARQCASRKSEPIGRSYTDAVALSPQRTGVTRSGDPGNVVSHAMRCSKECFFPVITSGGMDPCARMVSNQALSQRWPLICQETLSSTLEHRLLPHPPAIISSFFFLYSSSCYFEAAGFRLRIWSGEPMKSRRY